VKFVFACACGKMEERKIYLKLKLGFSKIRRFMIFPAHAVARETVAPFKRLIVGAESDMPGV
jgi:hypothetical protein